MNAIGLSIAWSTIQVTLIGFIASTLYFGARRVGPRLAATTAFCGLFMMALAVTLTFIPLPSWSPGSAPTLRRYANVEQAATGMSEALRPKFEAESTSRWLAVADEIWLAELERVSKSDSSATAPTTAFESVAMNWRWTALFAMATTGAIAIGAVRLIAGLFAARRYSRNSVVVSDRRLTETLDILKARLGCQACVDFHEHQTLESAATIGWRRPTILLPHVWRSWDANELQAVLAHELAHIHHRDFSAWVCAQLFVAVQFFHPLAHWLAGRLRLEQELAADAVAADITGSRTSYLTSLAELALHQDNARLSWSAQAFLPTRRSFLRRIEMLRNKRRGSDRGQQRLRPLAIGLLLAAGVIIVGWRRPELVSLSTPAYATQLGDTSTATASSPADLAFVPRDSLLVAAVRPSRLLARPELSEIAKVLLTDVNGSQVDLENLELAKFVFLPVSENGATEPDGRGTLLRFSRPTELLKPIFTEDAGEFSGRAIFQSNRSKDCATKIDERTVLMANKLPILRRLIAAAEGGPTDEKWVSQWQSKAADDAVVYVNLKRLKPMLEALHDRTGGRGPDPMLGVMQIAGPIWTDSNHAVGSISVDSGMECRIDITSTDEQAAKSVEETLLALATIGRNMLSGVRDSASRRGNDRDVVVLELADLAEGLIDNLKVETKGSSVSAAFSAEPASVSQIADSLAPALVAARAAARRMQDINSAKQILLALLNYESAHGHLPAATMIGPDGKTPHSWRVAILPYLEGNRLFQQYNFEEPWDGPNNKKLIAKMPSLFRSAMAPANSTNSSFFVFTGRDAAFDGTTERKLQEITDGTSKTIFLVDAKRDIPWTKPEDIPFDSKEGVPDISGYNPIGNVVAMGDGSVRFMPKEMDQDQFKRLITRNGGEPVDY